MQITQQTRYWHDRNGWNGQTVFAMDSGRFLMVWTRQIESTGELVTMVHVEEPNERGENFTFGSHTSGDYVKRWAVSSPACANQQAVRRQHGLVLAQSNAIEAEVIAFYTTPVALAL